jgi:hypothetical protein
MGRIKDISNPAAADPIRFPECLAIHAHTAMAIMIMENKSPKAGLKQKAFFATAIINRLWSLYYITLLRRVKCGQRDGSSVLHGEKQGSLSPFPQSPKKRITKEEQGDGFQRFTQ